MKFHQLINPSVAKIRYKTLWENNTVVKPDGKTIQMNDDLSAMMKALCLFTTVFTVHHNHILQSSICTQQCIL